MNALEVLSDVREVYDCADQLVDGLDSDFNTLARLLVVSAFDKRRSLVVFTGEPNISPVEFCREAIETSASFDGSWLEAHAFDFPLEPAPDPETIRARQEKIPRILGLFDLFVEENIS